MGAAQLGAPAAVGVTLEVFHECLLQRDDQIVAREKHVKIGIGMIVGHGRVLTLQGF